VILTAEVPQKVFVILPCYNEEEGIEKLLDRFRRVERLSHLPFEYVAVNDGSADHTKLVVESFSHEMSIHLIDFPKNQGVVRGFNAAFSYVAGKANDSDVVVAIDSDNTMNPFVVLDMLKALETSDVVIASRFVAGGKMVGAGYRAVLSHAASWLMRWRNQSSPVSDYSIFYRAYRGGVIKRMVDRYSGEPVQGKGFSCMANFLLKILEDEKDVRVQEVPLILRYDLKQSDSKVRIVQTVTGYLELAFRGRTGPSPDDR
jgi:dolichol-phosphate mannosyltransferase